MATLRAKVMDVMVKLLASLVSRHGMWAVPMDEDLLNAWSSSGNTGALVFVDPIICAADPQDNAERVMGMCIGVAWHWLNGEARRPDARAHYMPQALVTGVLAEMRSLGKSSPDDPQLSFHAALATVYKPQDAHDVGHVAPREGVTMGEGVGPLRPMRHAALYPHGCGRAKCPTCRDLPSSDVASVLSGVRSALHGGDVTTPAVTLGDAFGVDGPDAFGVRVPTDEPAVSDVPPSEGKASPLDFAGCVEPCVAFPQCVCGRNAGNGGKL